MGCFVTIEGVEGSGKSTLSKRVAADVGHLFPEIVLTREPGATSIGKEIRSLVLTEKEQGLTPLAELFLFAADRAQHLSEIVRPALSRGALVLCDRFVDSSYAYQGYGRGLDMALLRDTMRLATGGLTADLVVLLDLDPQIGLDRARARENEDPGKWTRFEADTLDFHRRIRAGFLELAKAEPQRFLVLDATLPPDDVARQAAERIARIPRSAAHKLGPT